MKTAKEILRKIIPTRLFHAGQPVYHYLLAFAGAIRYGFPSRKLFVIGVTGTKGKSSTTEIVNAILEEAGYKTALSNTIQFKIAKHSEPNMYKMSMPGLFFMQNFLSRALRAGCTHAVIEITSEGAKQFRNKWIYLDALIVTNLSPEHIESHGSYEKYKNAKLSIARELEKSPKKEPVLIINTDDSELKAFDQIKASRRIAYSLKDIEPFETATKNISMTFKNQKITSPLIGLFNIYNILASATCALAIGIKIETIKKALENFGEITGRVEKVNVGQNFDVIVDYAHTADSLEKLYRAFPSQKKICVLGNTGGGRDRWKRPAMAKIADTYCEHIVLTNEDPYEEDPRKIVDEMRVAIKDKPCEIIMDRREAIGRALKIAFELEGSQSNASEPSEPVVLITGRGNDPYIVHKGGIKQPWSDRGVSEEELRKLMI